MCCVYVIISFNLFFSYLFICCLCSGGNLKYWFSNRNLVEKTLDLFHDLGSGYSSSKVLIRIDQIQQVCDLDERKNMCA